MSHGSSVSVVNMLLVGQFGIQIPAEERDFSLLLNCWDRFWGPPSPQLNGHCTSVKADGA